MSLFRNHWKKSVFSIVVSSYCINYTYDKYIIKKMMMDYCQKAQCYGKMTVDKLDKITKVTIVLNPVSDQKRAVLNFERYCAPILHMAALQVDIVRTENENHTRTLVQQLYDDKRITPDKDDYDNILVIGGGDGTVSEVITGIFRKIDDKLITFGVLPLGQRNNFIMKLLGQEKQMVQRLAEASLAIVENVKKPVPIMKIETDEHLPIYSVCGLEVGCFRDLNKLSQRYWLVGPLRFYFGYVFNAFQYVNHLLKFNIEYKMACSGCSNCQKDNGSFNWLSRIVWQRNKNNDLINYSSITNTKCKDINNFVLSTLSAYIKPVQKDNKTALLLKSCPETLTIRNVIKNGINRTEHNLYDYQLFAREIVMSQTHSEMFSKWFDIDGEQFEIKPIKISILPNFSYVYCY